MYWANAVKSCRNRKTPHGVFFTEDGQKLLDFAHQTVNAHRIFCQKINYNVNPNQQECDSKSFKISDCWCKDEIFTLGNWLRNAMVASVRNNGKKPLCAISCKFPDNSCSYLFSKQAFFSLCLHHHHWPSARRFRWIRLSQKTPILLLCWPIISCQEHPHWSNISLKVTKQILFCAQITLEYGLMPLCLVMCSPIAYTVCQSMGLNPIVFAVLVGIGAAIAFATPAACDVRTHSLAHWLDTIPKAATLQHRPK